MTRVLSSARADGVCKSFITNSFVCLFVCFFGFAEQVVRCHKVDYKTFYVIFNGLCKVSVKLPFSIKTKICANYEENAQIVSG